MLECIEYVAGMISLCLGREWWETLTEKVTFRPLRTHYIHIQVTSIHYSRRGNVLSTVLYQFWVSDKLHTFEMYLAYLCMELIRKPVITTPIESHCAHVTMLLVNWVLTISLTSKRNAMLDFYTKN